MNEMCSLLDMPCMANMTFLRHQEEVASTIHDVAWEQIKSAAKEEADIAIEKGEIDKDGIPMITVVCDGSWAKRSYRTNYNSLSGVVRIKQCRFNLYLKLCCK